MKIVNRKEFLAMPAWTLFAKYRQYSIGELEIKGDTRIGIDYDSAQISDSVDAEDTEGRIAKLEACEAGASIDIDTNTYQRDALFDEDQLFAIYENKDIEKIIESLRECIK